VKRTSVLSPFLAISKIIFEPFHSVLFATKLSELSKTNHTKQVCAGGNGTGLNRWSVPMLPEMLVKPVGGAFVPVSQGAT